MIENARGATQKFDIDAHEQQISQAASGQGLRYFLLYKTGFYRWRHIFRKWTEAGDTLLINNWSPHPLNSSNTHTHTHTPLGITFKHSRRIYFRNKTQFKLEI